MTQQLTPAEKKEIHRIIETLSWRDRTLSARQIEQLIGHRITRIHTILKVMAEDGIIECIEGGATYTDKYGNERRVKGWRMRKSR